MYLLITVIIINIIGISLFWFYGSEFDSISKNIIYTIIMTYNTISLITALVYLSVPIQPPPPPAVDTNNILNLLIEQIKNNPEIIKSFL